MAAKIEIVHNLSGEPGTVILVGYKSEFPLVEIVALREVYPAPHSQETYLRDESDGVVPVMYIMRWFRSSDGIALDVEIPIALAVDASTGATSPITRIEYNVDGPEPEDPASGQNELRDARLLDKEYWIEERGTGSMFVDEITIRNDDGGGFDWTDPDKLFNEGGRYVAYIIEDVDTPSGGGGGTSNDGVITLTGATLGSDDFDAPTMDGKLLVTGYTGTAGTLVFAALSSLPDCRFRYSAQGGTQNYGVWQLNPGDTVQFKNQTLNVLYFEKGSSVECMIRDGVMYLWNYVGNYEQRGTVRGDSNSTRAATLGNLLLGNESTGVLNQSDYPGLFEYLLSLPVGAFVSLGSGTGQWSGDGGIHKSKWGISGTTFRVPHLQGLTRKFGTAAGLYEADGVGPITGATAEITKGNSYTGNPNNTIFGNGANNPTQQNISIDIDTGNTETTVKNFGEIPFIVL